MKTTIRKSLNGKLHLTLGMNAAFCSSGNRGMNFEAKVSAINSKMFPLDCFCKKCFGKDPLAHVDRMIKNDSVN